MKKFLLLALVAMISIAANAWTVKFTNPNNWTKVNAYVYNGAGEVLGGWPGTAMTLEGDVWTLTVDLGEPGKIIFNNGSGSQTGNLDFVSGATYDMNGVVGAALNDYVVYYNNHVSNWDEVYVYTYTPELFGNWPGKKIEANADGLFEAVISATSEPSCGGIIFSNGNGSQTADLTYEVGQTYDFNGVYTGGEIVIDYTKYYVNVIGDFTDWLDNGVTCDAEGIATLTDQEIGTSEFKVKVWNGLNDIWYSTGEAVPVGTWTKINGDSVNNMTVAGASATQKYNVSFNVKTGEILIDFPTAVENIEAADAEAVYYNLQGVRVANPEKGMFIKVQGNKTVKVAL